MDLVYIPEVLTFGSFRNPQYRDYEQPWNNNYFNDGKTPVSTYRHHQIQQQQREAAAASKESCHLCRENKRRSLAAYIRGKTRNKSCSEICEENEEEEEQQTTPETQKCKKTTKAWALWRWRRFAGPYTIKGSRASRLHLAPTFRAHATKDK